MYNIQFQTVMKLASDMIGKYKQCLSKTSTSEANYENRRFFPPQYDVKKYVTS